LAAFGLGRERRRLLDLFLLRIVLVLLASFLLYCVIVFGFEFVRERGLSSLLAKVVLTWIEGVSSSAFDSAPRQHSLTHIGTVTSRTLEPRMSFFFGRERKGYDQVEEANI
jgi:hypothetical protein